MEFWFLAAVASGLLSWGHFISSNIVDLIEQKLLNWTELDDAITEFNNEMPLMKIECLILSFYIIDTIFPFWYCAVALSQFVLLKALYK